VKRTILIVDRNLAFVFRLGRTLEAAGHQVLPARAVQDAKVLLTEFHSPIDLVVIHRATPGAHCLIEELRRSQGRISVVDLCGEERQKPDSQEDDTFPRRLPCSLPRLQGPVNTTECLGLVEGFLTGTLAQVPELLLEKS
jgi:hypothetical protein